MAIFNKAQVAKKLVQWARNELGDATEVEKEVHGDQSDVYRLHTKRGTFFLKIGKKLSREKDKLEWLQGKVSVPKIVAFTIVDDTEALLLSGIEGTNLAQLSKEWSPEKIVQKLVMALHTFHDVSTDRCPFGQADSEKVLVHGDACLPNFIYKEDNFSGYVDLGDMCIGSKEIDLSAAIWSLQHNLGKGYGATFLKQYGIENVTEEMAESLRLKYEDMQKEWFPEDSTKKSVKK